MEIAKTAAFQLQYFNIPKFSFEEPAPQYNFIDVQFNPSGIYNTSNGDYKLNVNFLAIAHVEADLKDYKELLSGTLEARFAFEEKPENVPDYFYANSLAIIYPYIRAFVSNITLQAGLRLLILPLLNLNSLSETLKKETTVLK